MVEKYRLHVAAVAVLALVLPPSLVTAAAEPEGERHRAPAPVPDAKVHAPKEGTVDLRILGVNDLHGNLEPLPGEEGRTVGGVASLDAHLDGRERDYPGRTIRVHAGDMVGGSPLVSGYYRDEPTVRAMNEIGFDVGAPGNHEFDEGGEEMLRLLDGGSADGSIEGPPDERFSGTDFPYVAANVEYAGTGEAVLPSYAVVEREGVRVGFIGVTTPDTPLGLMPEVAAPFRFSDMSEAVNRQAAALQAKGIEAIVVLAHAGGKAGRGGPEGEIFEETAHMSGAVDAVFSGHTHSILDERVNGKVVVQAGEYGKAFSMVDLKIDRRSGDVVRAEGEVLPVTNDTVRPDPSLSALVERYRGDVAPVSDRVVSDARGIVTRAPNADGESAMGDLIADGQRAFAGTDLAFVNSPGLRADLASGPVTYGKLFAVQPFGDDLVRMEMTGDAVLRLLDQQHEGGRSRVLQVSGLRYAIDPDRPEGRRVTRAAMEDGRPINRGRTYTVAADAFLAAGGDGFAAFEEGRNRRVAGKVIDALVSHLGSMPQPFAAPGPERERRISAL